MGRLFLVSLEEEECYSCKYCHTELALASHILSLNYGVRGGRAYCFLKAVNVTEGDKVKQYSVAGHCTLADIFCVRCGSIVGVKYLAAEPPDDNKGHCFLERYKVVDSDGNWFFEDMEQR